MATKLGIVAGAGDLPRRLIEKCIAESRPFFVFAIEGNAARKGYEDVPHAWIKLGRTGDAIAIAHREGVEEIVMAGAVRRPSFTSLLPDSATLKILGKAGSAAFAGDDGLLRAVVRYLEDTEGLKIVGIDEVLDDLVPEEGQLTTIGPDSNAWRDIERGCEILDLFSVADVGQSIVVQECLVLGIEAIEGTDALVKRCSVLRRPGDGGVLVKMRKREQERRVDLPTIGVTTVRNAAASGLRGIAIEAHGSLIVDRVETVRVANELGLFIIAINRKRDEDRERKESETKAPPVTGTTDLVEVGKNLSVFIIAGEASGDALGARLMESLQRRYDGSIRFDGIGGPKMTSCGLSSLFDMSELAVMGLVEVLPHIPRLRRRIAETVTKINDVKPDVLITIDAPGFCKRVVDALPTDARFPKIHYVAPSVWAWRPGRVHGFKKRFDLLLALLPFEPPYFDAVGLRTEFVGHSVLQSGADKGDGRRFRKTWKIPEHSSLLCLLPGSRTGEVQRLLDPFLDAVQILRKTNADLKIVIPCFSRLEQTVRDGLKRHGVDAVVVTDEVEKFDAMAASNIAIAASGTVALELALARVPCVIGYRVSRITYEIVRRLVRINYVHLLNHIAGHEIVPELLQANCTPEKISGAVTRLLEGEDKAQVEALAPVLKQLKPYTETEENLAPSDCAARAVLECVRGSATSKDC